MSTPGGDFDWTPEAEAKLIRLRRVGWSFSAIAEQMGGGLSKNAVLGKWNRLKRAPKPEPEPESESGVSLLELAQNACHWMLDRGRYCGGRAVPGKGYCRKHYEIVRQQTGGRKK